jgi:hypothetical protein
MPPQESRAAPPSAEQLERVHTMVQEASRSLDEVGGIGGGRSELDALDELVRFTAAGMGGHDAPGDEPWL